MTLTDPEKAPKQRHRAWRVIFILWLTMLAYGVPEVTAGTGRLWIIIPGAYLMGLPLYALHFLLLVQIALRTGRTSWPALYLFGVIFGLYETWITKVAWAGYAGEGGFSFGSFGPWFGVHETLGLIFFFHAVISFLLPLAVLSRLFPAWAAHFPIPDWVFGKGIWGVMRRLALLVILGFVTGHNNPVLPEYLLTWLPFLAVVIFGGLLLRRAGVFKSENPRGLRVSTPYLSGFGTVIAAIWMIGLYVVPFLYIRPEDTPPPAALIITALLYLPVFLILIRTKKQDAPQSVQTQSAALPLRWLLAIFLFGTCQILLANAGIGLGAMLALPVFVGMIPLGAGLILWLGIWRGVIRRR